MWVTSMLQPVPGALEGEVTTPPHPQPRAVRNTGGTLGRPGDLQAPQEDLSTATQRGSPLCCGHRALCPSSIRAIREKPFMGL